LILLWPSLAFWPSSIGKEAMMLFAIGVAALGAARVFTRRSGGYALLALGTVGAFLIRPHVALIMLGAFTVALVVGRRLATPSRAMIPASVAKVVALLALLVAASVLAERTADFLGIKSLHPSDAQSAFERTRGLTSSGGSKFSPADPNSPIGYPQAAVTILFRPFPFEAHGVEQVVTAIEALGLALLAIASWRRLISLPRRLRAEPYLAFALAFLLAFIFVFAVIGNFGILARERIQVLPFVFVLLAVLPVGSVVGPSKRRTRTTTGAVTRRAAPTQRSVGGGVQAAP
jgi:hypothetical protein